MMLPEGVPFHPCLGSPNLSPPLITVSTGFIREVHSFQPNREKGPWHWKRWEPLH